MGDEPNWCRELRAALGAYPARSAEHEALLAEYDELVWDTLSPRHRKALHNAKGLGGRHATWGGDDPGRRLRAELEDAEAELAAECTRGTVWQEGIGSSSALTQVPANST